MGGCASRPKELTNEAPETDDVAANVAPAPSKSTEAPAVESIVEDEAKTAVKEEPEVEVSEDKKDEPEIEASESKNEESKVEARENSTEEHKADEKTAEVAVVKEEPPVALA